MIAWVNQDQLASKRKLDVKYLCVKAPERECPHFISEVCLTQGLDKCLTKTYQNLLHCSVLDYA